MKFSQRETILMAIALGVGAVATALLMRPPATYEQCVVSELRGQPLHMTAPVYKLCKQRFGMTPD